MLPHHLPLRCTRRPPMGKATFLLDGSHFLFCMIFGWTGEITSLSSFPTPEGSSCRLCPTEWLMHEGKCYWASKESQIWHKSHDDCSAKSSRLLVIQDQKEMVK
uniref:C-type lectin domain-containing protein n=1 Tax=Gopherus agassizii TaxID=38772 RepID=A0A452GSR3_9SAUR